MVEEGDNHVAEVASQMKRSPLPSEIGEGMTRTISLKRVKTSPIKAAADLSGTWEVLPQSRREVTERLSNLALRNGSSNLSKGEDNQNLTCSADGPVLPGCVDL